MKWISALSLFFILGFSSCVQQEAGDFQREFFMTLDIPPDAHPLKTHIFERQIETRWIQFLQENKIEQKNIQSVKPRSVILTPIFDNAISYQIISEAHVSIYPYNKPREILPIADVYEPLGDDNELIFNAGLADVKDIVSQPEFIMRLSLKVRQVPGALSDHRLTVLFDIFLQ